MAKDDEQVVEVLKAIRAQQGEMLAQQGKFLWILLPIFALLAIQTILGLAGFFVE